MNTDDIDYFQELPSYDNVRKYREATKNIVFEELKDEKTKEDCKPKFNNIKINKERMEKSLSSISIKMPSGLSREEKRKFILLNI